MGTKVQFASNLPEFFTMRDLNEDTNECWSRYYEDEASGRYLYNPYHLRKSNGYSEYDKEIFKRKILEHEAVFREQVYELHRLYRIQKNMMDEFKRPNTSLSNSYSSQIHFESTNRMFQMTRLPESSINNSMADFPANSDKKPTLNFLNGSVVNKDDKKVGSNDKGPSRKMFDLQLPADTYFDCEEFERPQKGIVAEISSGTTRAQSGPCTQGLTDLNEPVKEMLYGNTSCSVYDKFLGSRTPVAETQGINFPMKSNKGFLGLPNSFLKGKHCDVGTSSNRLIANDDEINQDRSFSNSEAVATNKSAGSKKLFNSCSIKERPLMPFEHTRWNQIPHETLSKSDTWYKPKYEISVKNPHYGCMPSQLPNSFSNAALDYPIAASYQNGFNHGLQNTKTGVDPILSSYQNGLNHGIGLDLNGRSDFNHEGFGPRKLEKDVHINNEFINGFQNGLTTKRNNESETKSENISWLRKKSTSKSSCIMELDLSQGYPQLRTLLNNPKYERKHEETEIGTNLFNLQGLPSSSQVKETQIKSNKLFGFHIPEKAQQSDALPIHHEGFHVLEKTQQSDALPIQHESFHVLEKALQSDALPIPHEESQTIAANNKVSDKIYHGDLGTKSTETSFGKHIDLNIDLNSSDLTTECEMQEIPSKTFGIDLETPIALEEEEEEEKVDETVVKEAAESILLISSHKCSYLNSTPHVSSDTLHWFAELVLSNAGNNKEQIDHELDSFEQLTLDLEEIKPDEYLSRSWGKVDDDDDYDYEDNNRKRNFALLLFTKPRRGQARKRRKRDFQRDILPGLASLSKKEVGEDLQAIGGTSIKRRVGRKPRNISNEINVNPPPPLSPPPPPQHTNNNNNNYEIEIDGRNMIGWGRTTRRCRRQRFTPMSIVAATLT